MGKIKEVYIVMTGDATNKNIDGVFSCCKLAEDRALAAKKMDPYGPERKIEWRGVDPGPVDESHYYSPWSVLAPPFRVEVLFTHADRTSRENIERNGDRVFDQGSQLQTFCFARDEHVAKYIALERFGKYWDKGHK